MKTYLLPLKVENVKHTKLKENVEMKREKEGGKGRRGEETDSGPRKCCTFAIEKGRSAGLLSQEQSDSGQGPE